MAAPPLVLCYHAVSPTWSHRLSISPDLLLRQVRTLGRFRRVHVTFDDAYSSSATVFPQLERMGVPVQIFVCTRFARLGEALTIPELAGDDAQELATMNWGELRSHAERGVAVGSHGVTHAHLTQLTDDELHREVVDSKARVEDELGRPCPDFAYPYGEYDARVRKHVEAAGYERAYALRVPRGDMYAWPRLDLYRRHTPFRTLVRALRSSAVSLWPV